MDGLIDYYCSLGGWDHDLVVLTKFTEYLLCTCKTSIAAGARNQGMAGSTSNAKGLKADI